MTEAGRGGPTRGGGGADRVLPGLGRVLAGSPGGAILLSAWLSLWALVAVRHDRIVDTVRAGAPDEWVALAALVLGLAVCWAAANRRWRPAGRFLRRFVRHRQGMLGLVLLFALVGVAALTPYIAPYDPHAQQLAAEARLQAPSWSHPLGTDRFGRDVLSRVLYGARVSLGIGVVAIVIATTLGTLVGAVAGYAGGWIDSAAMRLVDLLLSFPRLVLLLAVAALLGPSIALVTVILGLTGWMGTSRIVRGEVLSLREQEYVLAARALGFDGRRILFRHVLPNALTPVIVTAALGVGSAILAEAALSFLGLGVQPPTSSWGNMVAAGRDVMLDAWWITLFPGLAIVVTVMSFNLVGDGLRDVVDPRLPTEP